MEQQQGSSKARAAARQEQQQGWSGSKTGAAARQELVPPDSVLLEWKYQRHQSDVEGISHGNIWNTLPISLTMTLQCHLALFGSQEQPSGPAQQPGMSTIHSCLYYACMSMYVRVGVYVPAKMLYLQKN